MSNHQRVRLATYQQEHTIYLTLRDCPPEPPPGIVKRTVDVDELIAHYTGPRIKIDLDAENRPVGIEILYPLPDDYDEDEGDALPK